MNRPGDPQILVYNSGEPDCQTIPTNWYSQTCYWNADDSFNHCTAWVYSFTTFNTYCTDNNPSAGGGGGLPDAPPPDCPPGTEPSDGGGDNGGGGGGGGDGGLITLSTGGKLVIRFTYGSSSNCVPIDTTRKKLPPKVDCMLSMLKNNAVFNNLINAFLNNSNYTLNFKVGQLINPDSRGETSTRPDFNDPTIDITLDINQINSMSAVSMAEVLIHEAYHAYIDQILIQHNRLTKAGFNNTFDSDFDKYVAYQVDSTQSAYLSQGINQNSDQWHQIQHEVMATDIDRMAKSLRDFVETVYPTAKTDPDYTFEKYQAYMWQGLINSQAFITKWGSINNPTYNGKNLLDQISAPCTP